MAVFVLFLAAAAQAEKGASNPKGQQSTGAAKTESLEKDGVESHFQKAKENFLKKEAEASASEIREAAAFIKQESLQAAGEAKKALESSAGELETLAEKVEKSTVASVKDLDGAFSRAHKSLAAHYQQAASEHWARKETEKAGHALKSAANHLEQAIVWGGHKLETGTKDVIDGSRTVAGKLIKGTGWVAAEVGKAMDDIGREVKKIGKKAAPAKESKPAEKK